MTVKAILSRIGARVLMAALALSSAPAMADVMEVGDDGAHWITGEKAHQPVNGEISATGPETATPTSANPVNLAVPAQAIADTSRHAGGIPPQYVAKVHELSRRFDLSPSLIEALVWQESRWRPNAVSHAGARGLAQLMPGTARYLGVNPDDPMQNLEGGARYLREQLDRFDGNLEKALAAYNAGPGRVIRAGGIPRIRETQHYVAAIMGRLSSYSRASAIR